MSKDKMYKLAIWRFPARQLPTQGNASMLDIPINDPELYEHMSGSWHVASHTLQQMPEGDWMLTVFLSRPDPTPNTAATIS